ncbi:MAG: hypothetical protein ACR2OG_08485 [Gemmatimonadaceae bacterium]
MRPLPAIAALTLRHRRRREAPASAADAPVSSALERVEASLYRLLQRDGLSAPDAAEECLAARHRITITASGRLAVCLSALGWRVGWGRLLDLADEIRIGRQLEDRAEGRIRNRQRNHTPDRSLTRAPARDHT